MRANEFIKRHGINRAKEVIVDTPARAEYYRDMDSVCSPNEVLYYVWFGCKLLVDNDGKWEPSIYHDCNNYILEQLQCISDLKRLIESHDLVEIHGYEKSKEIVANAPSDDLCYSWRLGESGVYDKTVNVGELRKAIADVESCQ